MKVCFVSPSVYPLFNGNCTAVFGGAEVQIYNFTTELAKDPGFRVVLITGDYDQPQYEKRENVEIFGMPFGGAGPPGPKNFIQHIRLNRLLKTINADVYIQRAAGHLTWEVGRFCHKYSKKFIYMLAHDSESEMGRIPSWRNTFISKVDWRIFRFGVGYSDHVIVQNDYQRKNIERYFRDKRVSIRPSAHRIGSELHSTSRNSVLWVARSDTFKNPELFLKLAEEMPSVPFVMVCTRGNDHAFHLRIETLAREKPNVRFLTYVPFREIENYFREARVFVNTSESEGFPNTFIQAAKTGTPILSYRVDPDGILGRYRIGLCSKGIYEKMVSDLKMLLMDGEAFRTFSSAGLGYCLAHHDIRSIVEDDKKLLNGMHQTG